MQNEEYINPRQLSAWLCIKLPTVYRLAKTGQIPSYKIGRQLRFRSEEINTWLERQRPALSPHDKE